MFFDWVKNNDCELTFSCDEEETLSEEDTRAYTFEHVKNTFLTQNENEYVNDRLLSDIEEETEQQIEEEAISFNNSSDQHKTVAMKINLVIKKMKKIITTFNNSNNLTRALLLEQKENQLNLLNDLSPKRKKIKCVLQLIQDVITR